ncbi:DUF551 domain-containing protein [Pectobacterium zantedeschiae]|uniref:DUF551 domain-containing protein n=1 Tax=Pectobacterium zantedeschiae TaxID=2034769 RepID=UPI0032EE3520
MGWIKCSERMPDICQEVIFFPECDEATRGYWDGETWYQDASWCERYEGNSVPEKVTHWMPLPEPPQD